MTVESAVHGEALRSSWVIRAFAALGLGFEPLHFGALRATCYAFAMRLAFTLTTATLLLAAASSPAAPPPADNPRMDWWREARFGMFIHWGLYSIPAGEWNEQTNHGEWIRDTAQIPLETYDQFIPQFNPTSFDANAWAAAARDAGMQYMVITSKHHDGFCLWNSEYTDFDIAATPFKRDILAELSAACDSAGVRFCLYHSIMDWHHPDYLPRRTWEQATRPPTGADFSRFNTYLRAQVTELLDKFPNLGVLWFDGEWESTWTAPLGNSLYDLCLEKNPNIIVNNRVSKGRDGMAGGMLAGDFAGDFGTAEQEVPPTGMPGIDWEACMTMNDHWGYNSADLNYKSTTQLIRTLCDTASKGGNFLLNIGPKADGTFPQESLDRLREIGAWMKINGEAIHGTTASPFGTLPFGGCTVRENGSTSTLYFLVFAPPADGVLRIEGLASRATRAWPLADAAASITAKQHGALLELPLGPTALDPHATVIAVEVEGDPVVHLPPTIVTSASIFVGAAQVLIEPSMADAEIRYTTDGTPPGPESPLYDLAAGIMLGATADLRAAHFRDGAALTGASSARVELVEPRPGIDAQGAIQGLRVWEVSGESDAIPDWSTIPLPAFSIRNIVTPTERENVACLFRGLLYIRDADVYTFALTSDDGSRFWIGEDLIIDNDGLHTARQKTGMAALDRGYHHITVEWFNRSGEAVLDLRLAPSGGDLRPVEPVRYRHLPSTTPR